MGSSPAGRASGAPAQRSQAPIRRWPAARATGHREAPRSGSGGWRDLHQRAAGRQAPGRDIDGAVIADREPAQGHELLSRRHDRRVAAAWRDGQDRTDRRTRAREDAHQTLVHELGDVERAVLARSQDR